MKLIDRALGAMLASAAGDSLGASVEFFSLERIRALYGDRGVSDLTPAFGMPAGVITDDTQQAIALGEGLCAAIPQGRSNESIRECVWQELKKWHALQTRDPRQQRAPGTTSMRALRGETMGTLEHPLNDSNSCGSVMRIHPVGILFAHDAVRAYRVGMELSALTHGGEQAIHAGAVQAALVARLCSGDSLMQALSLIRVIFPDSFRVLPKTEDACNTSTGYRSVLDTGWYGWDADEALAMAILAAKRNENSLQKGLIEAVNHNGDSDTVGAITGAILGAHLGLGALPRDWSEQLERRSELISIARTLTNVEQ